jgi:hypothetical protein
MALLEEEPLSHVTISDIPDVGSWDRAEERPTGSREKVTVIEPDRGTYHIFKFPKPDREHQIWSELLASYIAGDLLGWEVQHTGLGIENGRCGNLLEYVFEPGRKGHAQETFTEGWTFCKQVDPEFDFDKGTRHTLPLLVRVCDEVLTPAYGLDRGEFLDFWAKAVALDSLISNTDRHAENWAIVTGPDGSRMAPLYDNGSSLGCGLDEKRLNGVFDGRGNILANHLDGQRRKGRHHLRVSEPSKKGSHFGSVCSGILEIHPDGKRWFEVVEALDINKIADLMVRIGTETDLPEPYLLTERRQQHIYAMLQIGLERIRNALHRDD